MCTLHAGGKFDSKVYGTSGGLHGVGVSVANALSERMEVEVAREQTLYRMVFERGKPKGKLEKLGRVPNRRGTKVRFRPDPDIFGAKAHFKPERVFKMTRSKAYLFGGVEIRWSCAKELLRGVEDVPEKATFHFADGLKEYLSAAINGATLVHPDIFAGSAGKIGSPRRGAMGGRLDRRWRRLPLVLLQHHPDAGRRHPRVRACAARCSKGLKDHAERVGQGKRAASSDQRRRDDRRRLHGLGVHPRARVPGPDQGSAGDRGSDPHRRERDQGPVRPLARRQSAAGQQAARFRDRARRRAHPPPPGKGDFAQDRGAQAAPARQARRLHQHRRARLRAVHRRGRLGRRLGQAGARPRLAGDPAAARQDPQRGLGRQGQARPEPAARRPHAGARLRHRLALPRRGSALREGDRDDRRRRRRRPHRLAADHLLLPADARS